MEPERTSVPAIAVAVEVQRLIEGGYIAGRFVQPFAGDDYVEMARLSPDGARVVGLWPSADSYQALVAILERRIDDAPDEPTKSRFRKMLDTVTPLGKDVGTNFIANVLVEVGRRGV